MRIIDIHCHILPFPEHTPPRFGGGKFLCVQQQLDFQEEMGIEKSVILPIIAPEGQFAIQPTEGAMAIVENHPDKFLWFCKVDPRQGTFSADMDLGYLLSFY